MQIEELVPFWAKLTKEEQEELKNRILVQNVKKGTIIHNGSEDCTGLIIVEEGQLRAYTLSEDGKEITLYRMFQRDACLFAASCIMNNIQFEVIIEAREDSKVLTIPTSVYQHLIHTSLPVANFTNDLMASRFSDVMWVMEQILNKSVDVRLAALLVEEMEITERAC